MVSKQKILIVDDDNNIAELIALYLTKECFETKIVNDGEEALREFASFRPDLIILDEPLHGLDVSNKKKAAAIIEQFCSRPGKTLIYVTHYPHELPACVDKRFELVKHA